jgi:hypothetical protein
MRDRFRPLFVVAELKAGFHGGTGKTRENIKSDSSPPGVLREAGYYFGTVFDLASSEYCG